MNIFFFSFFSASTKNVSSPNIKFEYHESLRAFSQASSTPRLSQAAEFLCSPMEDVRGSISSQKPGDETQDAKMLSDTPEKTKFKSTDSQESADSQDINGNYILKSDGRRKTSKPVKIVLDSPQEQLLLQKSQVSSQNMNTRPMEVMSQNSIPSSQDTSEKIPAQMSAEESQMETNDSNEPSSVSQITEDTQMASQNSVTNPQGSFITMLESQLNTETSIQMTSSQMLQTPIKATSTQDPLDSSHRTPTVDCKTPNPFTPFSAIGTPFTPIEITPLIRMIEDTPSLNKSTLDLEDSQQMDSPNPKTWRSSQRLMESDLPDNAMVTPSAMRRNGASQETPSNSLPLSQQRDLVSISLKHLFISIFCTLQPRYKG